MIGRSKQFLPQTKHQQLLFEKRLPNLETIHTLPPHKISYYKQNTTAKDPDY